MLGEAESAKLAWKPATEVEVRGDDAEQLMKLIDALEDDDDVQTVWGNYDVPDEELEKLVKILGLDPGLGTTGWGLIAAEGNRLSPCRQRPVQAPKPRTSLPAAAGATSPTSSRRCSPSTSPTAPRSRRCSSTRTRSRR